MYLALRRGGNCERQGRAGAYAHRAGVDRPVCGNLEHVAEFQEGWAGADVEAEGGGVVWAVGFELVRGVYTI